MGRLYLVSAALPDRSDQAARIISAHYDPRPEEARAFLSARRLEGRPQAKSCPLPSFETVTSSKLRVTSSYPMRLASRGTLPATRPLRGGRDWSLWPEVQLNRGWSY